MLAMEVQRGLRMDLTIGKTDYSPKYPRYIEFTSRKTSFIDPRWPVEKKDLIGGLCKAGMYYVGPGDKCSCFFCGGLIESWNLEDKPWLEHCKLYYKCPYILATKGIDFVKKVRSTLSVEEMKQADDYIYNGHKIKLGLSDQSRRFYGENLDAPSDGFELVTELNILLRLEPKYANYRIEVHRTETFGNMSTGEASRFSKVGFLRHTNDPDEITCYQCGISARFSILNRNLTGQDDLLSGLWREHSKLNPWCNFVLEVKGRDFVRPILKAMTAEQKQTIVNSDCQLSPIELEKDPADVEMDPSESSLSEEQEEALRANLPEILDKEPEERSPEERKIIKIRQTCFVCQQRKSVMLCLPCRCLSLCQICEYAAKYCPKCRRLIKFCLRTYMS